MQPYLDYILNKEHIRELRQERIRLANLHQALDRERMSRRRPTIGTVLMTVLTMFFG